MDATTIHSWLHQFNAYFATRTMSNNRKVLLAAIYLAGDSINWYHAWQDEHLQAHVANMRFSLTDEPIAYSWFDFQEKLKA